MKTEIATRDVITAIAIFTIGAAVSSVVDSSIESVLPPTTGRLDSAVRKIGIWAIHSHVSMVVTETVVGKPAIASLTETVGNIVDEINEARTEKAKDTNDKDAENATK